MHLQKLHRVAGPTRALLRARTSFSAASAQRHIRPLPPVGRPSRPAWSGSWPSGTWEDPLPIASISHTRVVGCTGRPAAPQHETVWITVQKGLLCQCPDCHQVFTLEERG